MQMKWKFAIIALVAGFVGFLFEANGPIGSQIWPVPADGPSPSADLLPGFIVLGIIEALAFGVGVAFLVLFWSRRERLAPAKPGLAAAMVLSVTWIFVNWVPHVAMHMSNEGDDFERLLVIDWLFHVTVIIAGVIVAWGFVQMAWANAPSAATA